MKSCEYASWADFCVNYAKNVLKDRLTPGARRIRSDVRKETPGWPRSRCEMTTFKQKNVDFLLNIYLWERSESAKRHVQHCCVWSCTNTCLEKFGLICVVQRHLEKQHSAKQNFGVLLNATDCT
jgi:hypothetical protein